MIAPPVVILAGGASRRMGGGDKTLLHLNGRPVLSHVIDRLSPQTTMLAINTNSEDPAFSAFGLHLLPDVVANRPGPLAGVLTAMTWAIGAGHRQVVTAPADTPFLPADLIPRLQLRAETASRSPVLAQSGGRLHPVAALWPTALRDRLAEALASGTRRMTDWTESMEAVELEFPTGPIDPFFNINTPEDLHTAEAAFG